jgi:hypothetical protein
LVYYLFDSEQFRRLVANPKILKAESIAAMDTRSISHVFIDGIAFNDLRSILADFAAAALVVQA